MDEIAVDSLHDTLWVDANKAIEGERALLEVAILVLMDAVVGCASTEADLSRRIGSHPHRRDLRRHLRELQARGLVQPRAGGEWGMSAVPMKVIPRDLKESLRVVRYRLLARRSDTTSGIALGETTLARAAQELRLGNTRLCLLLLRPSDGAHLATVLHRGSSGSRRDTLKAEAYTLEAEAAMSLGRWKQAFDAAAKANASLSQHERWQDVAERNSMRVRLLCTSSAASRMAAVLDRAGAAGEHLATAEAALREAEKLADSGSVPTSVQPSLLRWARASLTTPLVLQGRVGRDCDRLIDLAYEQLPRVDDLSEACETHLFHARLHLIRHDHSRAQDALDRAIAISEHPLCRQWARGWIPRYRADLARASSASKDDLRVNLIEAWTKTEGTAFQRFLILARFALWNVEPFEFPPALDDDRNREILGSMSRFLTRWHRPLRGLWPSRCGRCDSTKQPRHRLLERIRCTLGVGTEESGGLLDLGLWR